MVAPLVTSALIAGGASLIDSIVNWFSGKSNRDWNENMWHEQNAYNTPRAQMRRLEEAGINPNAVVGHGSIVGNTAGQAPPSNLPTSLKPASGVLEALNAQIDLKNKAAQNAQLVAQTENMAQQNKLIQAQTQVAKAQAANVGVDAESKRHDLDILQGKKVGNRSNDPFTAQAAGRIFHGVNNGSLFDAIGPLAGTAVNSAVGLVPAGRLAKTAPALLRFGKSVYNRFFPSSAIKKLGIPKIRKKLKGK